MIAASPAKRMAPPEEIAVAAAICSAQTQALSPAATC